MFLRRLRDRSLAATPSHRAARLRATCAVLSVFYLASYTPLAYGGSCESMAGLAADVWGEFKQSALRAGCVLPGASHDVVTKFIACSAAKVQTGLVKGMLGWWNSTAQNRWATIGARSVGPEWQEGTLRGTTGRTFTSMAPIYSRTTVELQKLDGKARTEITICGFDASGRAAKITERTLDPEQVNTQQIWRFPIAQAAGHILTIKLDAKSALNNFNYRVRTVTEPIKWDYEAKGFADLHVHQAADLAAAGNYYWGSHTGKANEALPACHNLDPSDLLRAFSGQESKDLHALPFSMQSPTLGNLRHGQGHPGFRSWPHFTDIAHQQVHADWLKRAHEGGLNLIVVSAVNNEPQCRLLRLIYPNRNAERSCEDMDNVKRQLQAFLDFADKHDWYEIAVHPWHARKIIQEGKLAVVASVEASQLFPRTEGDFTKQLDELYAMGVRTLQPVHETDSRFAGAAPHRTAFELMQAVKWPTKVAGEIIEKQLSGFNRDENNKNRLGMGADGVRLTDYMVQRRMLIDTAHMSERAFKDYYDYVIATYGGYPLYNSHARFKALLDDEDRRILEEFLVTAQQIPLYKQLGGMVGIRTGFEHICDAPDRQKGMQGRANCGKEPGKNDPKPAVDNSCPGSSRSIAQMVDYADQMGLAVAFGSDFNGNTYMVSPRYGLESCYANRILNKGYVKAQGTPPGGVSPEFNEKGLAHIGLLPDLLADLRAIGTPGVEQLASSAEAFIRMWERAYDVQLAAASNEPSCKEDADCSDGWYCDKGLVAGAGTNKCKVKLADGQRCLTERVCKSGACDASICFTPASVALDGSCRVNRECKAGTCTSVDGITAGKCVCTEDTHCSGGEYCAKGFGPLSTNQCKARLADGAVCTGDHQCSSHRCSTVRPGDLQVTGICYTPNSKVAGASCKIDLECRTGKCNSNKRCVCHDDGDCGAAMWCDKGLDLKENNCRAKLDEGEECGPAGINIGHRCKSGKCKLSGTKLRCQ